MVEKLMHKKDKLIPDEITNKLKTKIIGKKIFSFHNIQSTNLYAKQLINENIEDGTIVISEVQTEGRGRKNRSWISTSGGLWFSVILYPDISPKSGMVITMTASISISQAIKEITGLKTEIKWPNDILLKKMKVCGILTELDSDLNKINYVIVGIGINVNNLIEEKLRKIAISLKQEIGSDISRLDLLKSILENFDINYNKLKNKDFDYIKKYWLSFSKIIGKKVKIIEEKTVNEGIVKEIDKNGYLILETNSGQKRILNGDVIYL
jgi:BirA family biotin operon repressor/biotin-[acetyl-CoA-carboxylase] ligase